MAFKKEIENLLNLLKDKGIDRRSLEETFDYRENYIDQVLSKGGNKRFYLRLKKYYDTNMSKSNNDIEKSNINNDSDTLATIKDIARSNVTLADANKVLADNNSDLIKMLKEATKNGANSITQQPGYVSAILQPYLQKLADGLANRQLKGADVVMKEFYMILGDQPEERDKSGKYG